MRCKKALWLAIALMVTSKTGFASKFWSGTPAKAPSQTLTKSDVIDLVSKLIKSKPSTFQRVCRKVLYDIANGEPSGEVPPLQALLQKNLLADRYVSSTHGQLLINDYFGKSGAMHLHELPSLPRGVLVFGSGSDARDFERIVDILDLNLNRGAKTHHQYDGVTDLHLHVWNSDLGVDITPTTLDVRTPTGSQRFSAKPHEIPTLRTAVYGSTVPNPGLGTLIPRMTIQIPDDSEHLFQALHALASLRSYPHAVLPGVVLAARHIGQVLQRMKSEGHIAASFPDHSGEDLVLQSSGGTPSSLSFQLVDRYTTIIHPDRRTVPVASPSRAQVAVTGVPSLILLRNQDHYLKRVDTLEMDVDLDDGIKYQRITRPSYATKD